jgi:hypothetical protein
MAWESSSAPGRIRTCDARFRNEAGGVLLSPASAVWAGQVAVQVRRFQPGTQSAIEKMGKRMGKQRRSVTFLVVLRAGLSTPDVPICARQLSAATGVMARRSVPQLSAQIGRYGASSSRNNAAVPFGLLLARRRRAVAHQSTEKSFQSPGTPFSSWVPRSANVQAIPTTAS